MAEVVTFLMDKPQLEGQAVVAPLELLLVQVIMGKLKSDTSIKIGEKLMALINSKGKYIKLSKNGYYEVYASEAARRKVKQSTPGETILLKYQELLSELMQPDKDEFRYYDPEGFAALYDPLNEEYYRY